MHTLAQTHTHIHTHTHIFTHTQTGSLRSADMLVGCEIDKLCVYSHTHTQNLRTHAYTELTHTCTHALVHTGNVYIFIRVHTKVTHTYTHTHTHSSVMFCEIFL